MSRLLIAVTLTMMAQISSAADRYESPVERTQTPHQYMVSAILKKNVQDTTVRLVQSIERANSKEEASGILFNRIKTEFKGYSVVDSIVSIVPSGKRECETWL